MENLYEITLYVLMKDLTNTEKRRKRKVKIIISTYVVYDDTILRMGITCKIL